MAESFRKEGILQLFGCGHSHLLAQEAYYHAILRLVKMVIDAAHSNGKSVAIISSNAL
ncbi:SIS domain-containing protein [Psychrobacillus glaciei]|uniref:SIS domain-containing protein n=1 Tax=Psychrobacillus glaciei TaxID=2283160 RepID=A0A5J6ST45_9BACI|nr:SIS domain-containing protein [Psychrobacillus glaciei]